MQEKIRGEDAAAGGGEAITVIAAAMQQRRWPMATAEERPSVRAPERGTNARERWMRGKTDRRTSAIALPQRSSFFPRGSFPSNSRQICRDPTSGSGWNLSLSSWFCRSAKEEKSSSESSSDCMQCDPNMHASFASASDLLQLTLWWWQQRVPSSTTRTRTIFDLPRIIINLPLKNTKVDKKFQSFSMLNFFWQ